MTYNLTFFYLFIYLFTVIIIIITIIIIIISIFLTRFAISYVFKIKSGIQITSNYHVLIMTIRSTFSHFFFYDDNNIRFSLSHSSPKKGKNFQISTCGCWELKICKKSQISCEGCKSYIYM